MIRQSHRYLDYAMDMKIWKVGEGGGIKQRRKEE